MLARAQLWFLALLGSFAMLGAQPPPPPPPPPLRVALHAQVPPSSGMVVGSVMTTNGLRKALLDVYGAKEGGGPGIEVRGWLVPLSLAQCFSIPSGAIQPLLLVCPRALSLTTAISHTSMRCSLLPQYHTQACVAPKTHVLFHQLRARTVISLAIVQVEVFYPFDYRASFFDPRGWDVVLIEGWFLSINGFIHEARRVSHAPGHGDRAGRGDGRGGDGSGGGGGSGATLRLPHRGRAGPVVLFWCLDPAFPGLQTIASLDLDGVLSNSRQALAELAALSPPGRAFAYVPLAAEAGEKSEAVVQAAEEPRAATAAAAATAEATAVATAEVSSAVAAATGRLVYVGTAGGLESKRALAAILREAASASLPRHPRGGGDDGDSDDVGDDVAPPLALFGSGWGGHPEWAPFWRGVLPHAPGALDAVYRAAFAVIGAWSHKNQKNYVLLLASSYSAYPHRACAHEPNLPSHRPGCFLLLMTHAWFCFASILFCFFLGVRAAGQAPPWTTSVSTAW